MKAVTEYFRFRIAGIIYISILGSM